MLPSRLAELVAAAGPAAANPAAANNAAGADIAAAANTRNRFPGGRTRGVAAALRALIVDGRLLPGDRLPAERALATALDLSRSTVTAAYDQLRHEGYLVGRRGAGTFVGLPAVASPGRPDEEYRATPQTLIDLTAAALPAPAGLAEAAAAAAESLVVHLAGIGLHPAGLPELQELVAEEYRQRGVPTRADQILITSGALHGWDMLLRTFARPGALVVTEQPTYPGVIDAALAHRVRLRPLAVDEDGWHPEELDLGRAPVLVHVTFDGHNPTGRCADDETRRRVVGSFDPPTILVDDESMVDFSPIRGLHPARLAHGSSGPTVVSLGSASKSMWSGLRVGWLRGPADLVRRVAALRSGQDLAPPVLSQLVVVEMLRHGRDFLVDRRALVAARRDALLAALARYCPEWTVVPPQGGLSTWMDLGGRSSTQLAIQARDLEVRITPGTRFTHSGTHDQWLRLPAVQPGEVSERAVEKLAAAAANLQPARPRRHSTAAAAWTA